MSCAQSGPEQEIWEQTYAERGLVPWAISIGDTYEGAQTYWEVWQGHTHAWAADQLFSTGQFFPGPMVGTPAFILIDLCTMEILHIQEGYSNQEESLFEPFLDRTCGTEGA